MKIWKKIMRYPIGLYLWLTDRIKKMSKKWKPAMAMLMAVVMLCGMLPTMANAAGWSGVTVLGFNYGDDGFLNITAPSTVGNYTYGTANGDTAAETAVNQSVLPESGWQWALKRESSGHRLILNDFNITYSGNDDVMMSDTDLIIELRGSNSVVKTSSSASGSAIASNMNCTLSITGEGSLNVAGCTYAIYTHLGSTLTIESGNVTLGASYSTIYASKVELGEYVTAQSSLNSDGSNPSSFASGSRPGNYKWFQTVTNIPEYTLTFDANGGSGAMSGTTISATTEYVLPECTFTAPSNKAFKAWEVNGEEKYDGETITVTEDTTIKAIWMDKSLGVKVGNVKVTTDNAANITGDGIVSGTVSYDYKTRTLTLNNATIYASTSSNAIKSNADLTIKLIGENTLYGEKFNGEDSESWQWVIKIEEEGNLDIIGAGSLTVNGAPGASHSSYSIYLYDGDLTVGGDCTVILNPSSSNRPRPLSDKNITIFADDSVIFVSKSLDDEPLEAYDPDDYYDIKYMKIVPKYNIEIGFDANGGSGTMNAVKVAAATKYKLPECGFTAPDGKQFKAWSVGGEEKQPGDKITVSANTTVTAIWQDLIAHATITITGLTAPQAGQSAEEWLDGCSPVFSPDYELGEVLWFEGAFDNYEEMMSYTDGEEFWWNFASGQSYTLTLSIVSETPTLPQNATLNVPGATSAAYEYWGKSGPWYFACIMIVYTAQDAPTEYDITVNGGTASANKAVAGTVITLTVDESAIPAGKVFDKWEVVSGGVTITDGKFTMPESAVEINATYKDAPVSHTCDIKPVAKDEPSCTEGGKEAHYKCEGCGKFFEDANGTTVIANIETWGNLPKNGHTHGTEWKSDEDNHWNECACGDKANTAAHKDENADGKCDICAYNVELSTTPNDGNKPSDNPQTGDNTQPGLWIALLAISSFGLAATAVYGKKRRPMK